MLRLRRQTWKHVWLLATWVRNVKMQVIEKQMSNWKFDIELHLLKYCRRVLLEGECKSVCSWKNSESGFALQSGDGILKKSKEHVPVPFISSQLHLICVPTNGAATWIKWMGPQFWASTETFQCLEKAGRRIIWALVLLRPRSESCRTKVLNASRQSWKCKSKSVGSYPLCLNPRPFKLNWWDKYHGNLFDLSKYDNCPNNPIKNIELHIHDNPEDIVDVQSYQETRCVSTEAKYHWCASFWRQYRPSQSLEVMQHIFWRALLCSIMFSSNCWISRHG